jgi:hypothetical protein
VSCVALDCSCCCRCRCVVSSLGALPKLLNEYTRQSRHTSTAQHDTTRHDTARRLHAWPTGRSVLPSPRYLGTYLPACHGGQVPYCGRVEKAGDLRLVELEQGYVAVPR